MRAIDADALCEDLLKRWSVAETRKEELIKAVMADVVTPIIACQPTIEPERKKGHWIRHPEQRNIFNGKTIECSECHEKYTVQYVEDELFCRHCGADKKSSGRVKNDQ